jgi:hypothetical protein
LLERAEKVKLGAREEGERARMALTTMPLWLSGLLVVVVPTAVAMSGPILIRARLGLDRVRVNNEVAGFKFATVGVLYAVLLAFAVIVVWEKFSEADRTAAKEAGAVATLYRLSNGMGPQAGQSLRDSMTAYARSAIRQDWPAMARGGDSEETKRALDRAYAAALTFAPPDPGGATLLAEALQQLDRVTQACRERILRSAGTVPGVLWAVLTMGAVLTVAFTFFFGAQNVLAQSMMTGVLGLLIFSGMLVIVTIDRPFAGPVSVGPGAMSEVLHDFAGVKP